MAAKKCADCGAPIPQKPMGGPRKYCETCSPPTRQRGKPKALAVVADVPVEPGKIHAATLASLTDAERVDSPLGQVALALAEQMDAGGHAATGYAALAKQLESTLDSALRGAKSAMSALDELRARRERRRGA